MKTSLVEFENVTKSFKEGEQTIHALAGVSLHIEQGSFTALAGPSGSGKTTILNLIGCLDRPSQGKVSLDGEDVGALSQQELTKFRLYKIGFIFQDYNLIPTLSAQENIEYVLWLQGVSLVERRKRSFEVCKQFGIEKLVERRPAQMSRGQQQRVAVARAIVHRPRLVLGDELTANLDHKTAVELIEFLRELNKNEGITFVYATHDPVMIERAGSVIRVQDGRLIK